MTEVARAVDRVGAKCLVWVDLLQLNLHFLGCAEAESGRTSPEHCNINGAGSADAVAIGAQDVIPLG